MSGDIVVSGGAGGVGARLQDLRSQAGLLDDAGDDVRAWSGSVAAVAVHQDVTVATLLCPVEVAQVAGAVAGATIGVNGLLIVSTGLEASAIVLRASATTYEFVDATQQQVMEALQHAAGFALGAALPGLVLGGGVLLVGGGLVVLGNPATWPALALAVQNVDLAALGDGAMDALYDNPWLLESLTKVAPSLVQGTTWSLGSLLGGPLGGLALPYVLSGGKWPTASYEDAVGGLVNAGGMFGMFGDTGEMGVSLAETLGPDRAPTSVEEIFQQQNMLGADQGEVQIVQVTNPDGTSSYIVQIPGTQEWGPQRGSNPVDLTTNVRLMAGDSTLMQQQVAQAMREAGIRPGDPVMLTGHSQGGITAAALASDPAFREEFAVRSVVTGGSPIARFDIPPDVSVLSLEHDQDAVPMLEGRENPDRANWVTVERDLGTAANGVLPDASVGAAHGTDVYAQTGAMVDASDDPSVQAWREGAQQFFTGEPGTVTRWDVSTR
ncbi:hypothetical protein [Cellulomonas triticagri]|uniref:Alpha/beta hydrolase n=1 Tax=Cellulomonas triticagri TaxID=2483352 RepID=A0A3M2IV47_9CELL|nr:hypothetical protein [Cellulomonas triticagri]RMI04999.1 hypothetical protein EBM89_16925 [Cellulomonas triticagri]